MMPTVPVWRRLFGRPLAGCESGHVLVCPPAVLFAAPSAWRRLLRWLAAPTPWARPADRRLAAVRDEFTDALSDLGGSEALWLRTRLERARTLRELWHLRASLYNLVAVAHSQHQAELRLARLNRHFPTRAPLSGFAPLEP
ncbi:hypothetical protein BurJ1DRAFT_1974 [Burkholderiales bacterium JOSHI_001]|nr:hypothetical protein BurJ1DRAFT_1974 [Burkholderiales bacterium JOSHI_001]